MAQEVLAYSGPSTGSPPNLLQATRTMDVMFALNPMPSLSPDVMDYPATVAKAEKCYLKSCGNEKNSKKENRSKKKNCNKPYTLEQIHFIQYCREDLGWSWPHVHRAFKTGFNDPQRSLKKEGGLQCRYYRAQVFPLLDIGAMPVLDGKGQIIMIKLDIRERKKKKLFRVAILDCKRRPILDEKDNVMMRELTKDERNGHAGLALKATLQEYFKLGDRVPELACTYEWVMKEDARAARHKAKYRADHNIVLPGALSSGGKYRNTVLAINAAGEFLDPSFRVICDDSNELFLP